MLRTEGTLRALGGLALDFLGEKDGRLYIVARPEDLKILSSRRVPYASEAAPAPLAAVPGGDMRAAAGGINGDYHSYGELEAGLEALAAAHPRHVRVVTIGTSLEGRKIDALRIGSDASTDGPKAEILILGCHHAREWISVEVPFRLAERLAAGYEGDPAIREIVDHCTFWIVPLINPDGLEYSINVYRYWRKNRRANRDGSFGVDLNRNYGYMWGYDDGGSSPEPESEVFRGESPFSEPETRAVRDLFLSRNIGAMVSFHSFSQAIYYPWGYDHLPTDKDTALNDLANRMASRIAAVHGRSYAVGRAAGQYTTNGDTIDWAFGVAGVPAFTIELPPVDVLGGGFFNAEADIAGIFEENFPAVVELARQAAANAAASRLPPVEKLRRHFPLTKDTRKDK
ncbi:MAG: M14 family metallopeptidase [Candidatus Aminicenantales bacterium]